ncbi:MAG: hypothetical protein SFW67_12595 [Myxococcaceae bacterium]|nr:hypothetical protein [Myxococcaceae bacterium]
MKVRFNAAGNSLPWLRVALGTPVALFGAYGLWYELDRKASIGFFKTGDLAVAVVLLTVGTALAAWGLWRTKFPAQWIEVDTEARTLTLGLGGPLRTVPFAQVGALSVELRTVMVKRRYVKYPFIVASGIPETTLYAGLDEAKAQARKAELEALLK